MSNASILTDTAKNSAQQTVYDFGVGVYAHVNGDYGGHTQIRVTSTPYVDNAADRAQDSVSGQPSNQLRLLSTEGTTDFAVVVPCILTGTSSAIVGQPPLIIRSPQDQSKVAKQQMYMDVYAISDLPLSYQWQKAPLNSTVFSNVNGQTKVAIVLTNLKTTDAGIFRVLVSNANGTAISQKGTLTVAPLNPLITASDDDGFGLPSFFQPGHGLFGDVF